MQIPCLEQGKGKGRAGKGICLENGHVLRIYLWSTAELCCLHVAGKWKILPLM